MDGHFFSYDRILKWKEKWQRLFKKQIYQIKGMILRIGKLNPTKNA
jgi:hypothetical protein